MSRAGTASLAESVSHTTSLQSHQSRSYKACDVFCAFRPSSPCWRIHDRSNRSMVCRSCLQRRNLAENTAERIHVGIATLPVLCPIGFPHTKSLVETGRMSIVVSANTTQIPLATTCFRFSHRRLMACLEAEGGLDLILACLVG